MVKDLNMLPLEMIVRDYLTGSTETSIWPMYERGERILYGHDFPEGLQKNQLPAAIIAPTTKAARGMMLLSQSKKSWKPSWLPRRNGTN